jgi:hypothetical protein
LNYAKEELRAELASVFIAAELGVPHDPANHAAYVGSWIRALKDDKHEIFKAAHDASAAADYVIRLEREISKAESLEISDSTTVKFAMKLRIWAGIAMPLQRARGSLAASFAAAKTLITTSLGDSAKTYVAQTQSGTYRGEIIGETDLHVLQRLSAQSAVAHMKQLLDKTPEIGTNAVISYSNDKASIREWRERTRTHELAR